jgi:hypothetical protein
MTRALRVSPELALPEDTVTSTLIVFGGKGMGKTNFGGVLVEELSAARLRWCVLDPLGVWWGLRHSVDGSDKGVECLLLGGVHGDIPIEPTGGAIVADLVVDEDADVIIDFSRRSSGQMWTKGERIRFVTDYAVRLFQRQGELIGGHRRPPIFVVLDEAARYIPQTVRAGDKDIALCVGAWEDLVEEGRNVGIGVGLLTQRSARINKSVSELADALLAFRTVGPLSLGAVMDWLGEHVAKERIRELVEQVRSLDVGSALVVSPGWLRFEDVVHIRARRTFDSSATPKAGDARRVTGAGAKPDLAKYQERMAATIEKAKADDPKELRRRIAELERRTATPAAPEVRVETVVERVEVPVLNGQVEKLSATVDALVTAGQQIADTGWEIIRAIDRVNQTPREGQGERAPRGVPAAAPPARDRAVSAVATLAPAAPRRDPAPVDSEQGEVRLKAGARRMLSALAQLHPTALTRPQLGTLADVTPGGTFSSYLSSLRMAGLVDEVGSLIGLTPAGIAATAGELGSGAPTTEELVGLWGRKLKAGARRMLEILVDSHPEGVPKAELADRAGVVPGGTLSSYLSSLRRNGLLDESGGVLRAGDALFLGSRR